MARIAVVSKYFGYNIGGAELSVLEMMKQEMAKGHQVVALSGADLKTYGAHEHRLTLPENLERHQMRLPIDIMRFRFFEYYANKSRVRSAVNRLGKIDRLYTYGLYAPAAINAFGGPCTYLVRDEYGLGWNRNYYQGMRRALQAAYHAVEWPLRKRWRRELLQAMRKSRLIANSQFIAAEMRRLVPEADVAVIYSKVDARTLRSEYQRYSDSISPRGIVAIGDNVLKGGDLVRKVAKMVPDQPFYLFDRRYRAPEVHDNLMLMPWKTPGQVYAHAKLVMVPSRWQDAYPRVVLEARILGIPVVASARGGIPEAVDFDERCLIHDIEAAAGWAGRIKQFLGSRAACPTGN